MHVFFQFTPSECNKRVVIHSGSICERNHLYLINEIFPIRVSNILLHLVRETSSDYIAMLASQIDGKGIQFFFKSCRDFSFAMYFDI